MRKESLLRAVYLGDDRDTNVSFSSQGPPTERSTQWSRPSCTDSPGEASGSAAGPFRPRPSHPPTLPHAWPANYMSAWRSSPPATPNYSRIDISQVVHVFTQCGESLLIAQKSGKLLIFKKKEWADEGERMHFAHVFRLSKETQSSVSYGPHLGQT